MTLMLNLSAQDWFDLFLHFSMLSLLGIGGAAFWQLRPSTPPPATPLPAAATGPIGVGALGRVEPASRIRRLNQPGGMAVTRLDRLLVAEGAEVTQGQLLAEFADTAMKDAAAAQGLAAVAEAEIIIDAGVQSFMHWVGQRDPRGGVVELIRDLQTQTDEWRAAELARARKLLARGDDVEAVLEALARGLTQKMLHGTLAELHTGDAATRQATAQTVARLFLRGQGKRQAG